MGNPIMGDRTNLGSCHRLQTHFGSYEQSIYCFCNDFLSGNIYNSLWIDSLMWGGGTEFGISELLTCICRGSLLPWCRGRDGCGVHGRWRSLR